MDEDSNLKAEYDRYQRGQFGGRSFEELTPEERTISQKHSQTGNGGARP